MADLIPHPAMLKRLAESMRDLNRTLCMLHEKIHHVNDRISHQESDEVFVSRVLRAQERFDFAYTYLEPDFSEETDTTFEQWAQEQILIMRSFAGSTERALARVEAILEKENSGPS